LKIDPECNEARLLKSLIESDINGALQRINALLDEMQAEAVNRLRSKGILSGNTRMVPDHYDTFVQLGSADLDYYGYRVLMPKHQWPHYTDEQSGWLSVGFRPQTGRALVSAVDFRACINTEVEKILAFTVTHDGEINAIRLSGCAHLTDAIRLHATNAFNGDKVVPITPFTAYQGQSVRVRVNYTLGGGLSSLQVSAG
jgi:hypothetical protein